MMQHLNRYNCLKIILLIFVLGSCRKQEAHSEMFTQIFKDPAVGTFRGVRLGMDLLEAKKIEGSVPKHDDQWGYVYESSLGGKSRYFLEYICRDPSVKKVNAIVLNVLLEEKAPASDLFSEMEAVLRNQYGVADGSLANLKWSNEELNLLVTLRMLDDKKSISLNYGMIQSL